MTQELMQTAHCSGVHDVVFAHGCSDLVATCSHEEIRVWATKTRSELLRIRMPGVDCYCLAISQVSSASQPFSLLQ